MARRNLCEPSRKAQAGFRRSRDRFLRTTAGAKMDENGIRRRVEDRQLRPRCADSEVPRTWLSAAARRWFRRGIAQLPPSIPTHARLRDQFLFLATRPQTVSLAGIPSPL